MPSENFNLGTLLSPAGASYPQQPTISSWTQCDSKVYDENMKTRTLIAYPQHQRDFMEKESKRRDVSMAAIARELMDFGIGSYQLFYGLNQRLSKKTPYGTSLPKSDSSSTAP